MIPPVFPCLGVMVVLCLTSVCPADTPPPSICLQICDKYRKLDTAFSLKCEDHKDDKDCVANCQECKDMCTDYSPRKVYSCPTGKHRKTDKRFDGKNESNESVLGIVFWIVGILIVVIILVVGVVWYVKRRNKRGLLMGGEGVRPAFPVLAAQQSELSIAQFELPVMSEVPEIPSEYRNQKKSKSMTNV